MTTRDLTHLHESDTPEVASSSDHATPRVDGRAGMLGPAVAALGRPAVQQKLARRLARKEVDAKDGATSTATPGKLPKANLGKLLRKGDTSVASELDWDGKTGDRTAQISPEATGIPALKTKDTLKDVFRAHRDRITAAEAPPYTRYQELYDSMREDEAAGHTKDAQEEQRACFAVTEYALVATLNSEGSDRYKFQDGKTRCNVYAHDFVTAMGGYLPTVWWTPGSIAKLEKGEQVAAQYEVKPATDTVYELNANGLYGWMMKWGVTQFGWKEQPDPAKAQQLANGGRIVIILAKQDDYEEAGLKKTGIGHVTVVLPELGSHKASTDEIKKPGGGAGEQVVMPVQSEAGDDNRNVRDAESDHAKNNPKLGRRGAWWKKNHVGSLFYYTGELNSPIGTPDQLGMVKPQKIIA